jgi:pimeloyl-ACP methyl ester carboxylesterase
MCALEAEEGFARASDGRRIAYRVSGKGPFALVMPANWGVDSYVYTRGLSALEFWLALVTFDPRGVGRSDPVEAPEEYSMDVTARDAASVADALHLDRTVVLGHSNGGAVALTYALAFPERVSHLVLISTGATWDRTEDAGEAPYPSTEEEMRRQVAASIPIAVHEPSKVSRAMEELLRRMRFSPDRFRWTGEVEYARYDLRPRLPEIRVPVLILHGTQDRVVSVQRGEELHRGIAGSCFQVFESCGHWPFVECRQEFVEAATAFLGLESRERRR